ncbi:MAG: LysM peptidoglycan-binding domain-containing protein [Anaerolineaceae bacterium]
MKRSILFLMLILLCLMAHTAVQAQASTPVYQGVIVSTPNADGSIYHYVVYGDTLWNIAEAYGVSPRDIMILNGNSPDANEVYAGTYLLIRKANTPTPYVELSPTPVEHTPRPTLNQPSRTPIPSNTPLPTATATPPPSLSQRVFGNSQHVGLTMISISLLGIILVVIFGFLRKSN